MITDGNDLAADALLEADVAIVGAGPAGLTIAADLRAAGVDVLVLEAGGREDSAQAEAGLAGVGVEQPVEFVRSRRRGFGGTSRHWEPDTGLRLRRFDTFDLETRPVRGDASWPIGADELERYYRRAFDAFDFAAEVEPSIWFGAESPTPLSSTGGAELAMFRIAEHDWFVRRYQEFADDPRTRVVLHSVVTGMSTAADAVEQIEELAVTSLEGTRFRVRARFVVLAASAVDNVRLLLASPGATGAGVGNEHDNVGRWFQDHLGIDSGILVPAPGVDLRVEHFAITRDTPESRYQTMLSIGAEKIVENDLLNAVAWIRPIHPDYLSRGVGALRRLRAGRHTSPKVPVAPLLAEAAGDLGSLARFGADRVRRRNPAPKLSLRYFTEQRPDRESRVTLADTRDPFGLPQAKIDWRISADDVDHVRRHQDILATMLEERGVGTVADRYDPDLHAAPILGQYHNIGCAKMHVDPRHGVVDADLRVHSTRNLYVAGSAVFPTGSYANPTLMILALAHRLADELSGRLQRG